MIACARFPAKAPELNALAGKTVTVHSLDVSDFASIDTLAKTLGGTPIDELLNNAGVIGPRAAADNDPANPSVPHREWSSLVISPAAGAAASLNVIFLPRVSGEKICFGHVLPHPVEHAPEVPRRILLGIMGRIRPWCDFFCRARQNAAALQVLEKFSE